MDAWERWWLMAQGSLIAAQTLADIQESRSSASRAYYAAYQAVTAILHYSRLTPPDGREAWSHADTPELLRNLQNTVIKQGPRRDISLRLEQSYRLRLDADYIAAAEIVPSRLKVTLKDASFIVKIANDVLL